MWSTAYAEGSIPQVISGHSYSRALRAHILSVQETASVLLSAPGVLDQVDAVAIHRTWYDFLHENIALEDALSTKEVFQVAHILEQEIEKARKLGLQPSYGFNTLITPPFHPGRADRRLGPSHYECVGDVYIPCCCSPPICKVQLYLQEMERIDELLPADDFEKYINQGCFTPGASLSAGLTSYGMVSGLT